jgi:hypothetical protein
LAFFVWQFCLLHLLFIASHHIHRRQIRAQHRSPALC